MLTPERLDELEALAEAATPGPWVVGDDASQVIAPCPCCGLIATCDPYGIPTGDRDYDLQHHYNSGFIAASRQAIPELIAEVRRLRQLLSAAQPVD